MKNTATASLMQWSAQPLSDKFLSKKAVKVGLEFEVFYDDPNDREDEYEDEYSNENSEFEPDDDEDDEARASTAESIVGKVDAVHIPSSTTHAVREFYRHLATEFYSLLPNEKIISMAPDYNYYRKLPGKYSGWNFAYDSSIVGGFPVEVISPVMDVSDNLEGKLSALWKFFTRTSASTNESTGLHVTISSNEGTKNFNPLVFAILAGDEYLLDKFSRLEATYARNSTEEMKEILEQQGYLNAEDEDGTVRDDLDAMLEGVVGRTLLYRLPDERQRSINLTKLDLGVIEYRGMGDDYLDRTDAKELTRIIRRLASAFVIACDPMSLDNENLRKWLRKRLYLQLVEGYKTKDEYKAQFNGRVRDFDTAPFANRVEDDPVAGAVKLTAVVHGASNEPSGLITVRSRIFEIHSNYIGGKWELMKLVIAPKATETKESTIELAKVIRKYLVQLTRSGLPSDMRRELYKARLDKKKGVTPEIQGAIRGTLDLGGRTVAQVIMDAILGEANKRMWRIAKTDPAAYKRSSDILKLQENRNQIKSIVYTMPVLDNVRVFAERLSTNTNPGSMKHSIASEARVQLELSNANYDFIDTVTALSLGVPLVLAVSELLPVMYKSASWAEAHTRKTDGFRGAYHIMTWRNAARYLDTNDGVLNVSKIASLAAKSLVICGATGSDVVSEDTVRSAWEALKTHLHDRLQQEYNTEERHIPQLLLMDPTVPLSEGEVAAKLDEMDMA